MTYEFPEGWEIVEIHKLGKIITGKTPRTKIEDNFNGTTPFLTPSDDMENRFVSKTARTLSKKGVESVKNQVIPKDSIAVSCIGSQLGKVVITQEKTVTNQQINSIVVNENTNNVFVYYSMLLVGERLRHISKTSTAVPIINKTNFSKEKILLPTLPEQKIIADTLSALDDKIENNDKINKILEDQAQAIFKHWFVDFEFPDEEGLPYKSSGGEMIESELGQIPKGWSAKKLKEIVKYIKEPTKPGEHLIGRNYITINNLGMKSVAIESYLPYNDAKSSLVLFEKFDILIGAMRVYFHRVNLAPFKGVTRTTTFVIRSKKEIELSYNLFLLNMEDTIGYADKTSKGTTMPYAVWENGLGEMLVANPSTDLKKEFNDIVLPGLKLILLNREENKILSQLRDTLLPKLMSGEIRIPLD